MRTRRLTEAEKAEFDQATDQIFEDMLDIPGDLRLSINPKFGLLELKLDSIYRDLGLVVQGKALRKVVNEVVAA